MSIGQAARVLFELFVGAWIVQAAPFAFYLPRLPHHCTCAPGPGGVPCTTPPTRAAGGCTDADHESHCSKVQVANPVALGVDESDRSLKQPRSGIPLRRRPFEDVQRFSCMVM